MNRSEIETILSKALLPELASDGFEYLRPSKWFARTVGELSQTIKLVLLHVDARTNRRADARRRERSRPIELQEGKCHSTGRRKSSADAKYRHLAPWTRKAAR